jgi:hypothetical protein
MPAWCDSKRSPRGRINKTNKPQGGGTKSSCQLCHPFRATGLFTTVPGAPLRCAPGWHVSPLWGWWRVTVAIFVLVGLAASASAEVFEPKQRFLGMRNNGERLNDERVTEWGDQAAVPKLAGQPIFDAGNPFRWLIDQAVPLPVAPEAFVEFLGGDCLPGRVVDYVPAESNSFEAHGELLVVEPLVLIDVPGQPTTPFLRIDMRWLRRVVFQKRSTNPQRYQPGTVFLHDGSQLKFSVVRWTEAALSVLTEAGVQTLLFSQVAELHMPAVDPWNVYFEQLATLSPNLDSRLLQVETSTGLSLTASTERYRPQFSGDKNKSENWYPMFQPAWSLDPISVPFKEIRTWRFFSALEPPMTLFEPTSARLNPVFSGGWNWQRNQSVQRSPLKNVSLLSGWGFGVHAPTELAFALHPAVTGVRTRLGLDNVVEKGGSAEALVALSTNEAKPIYKSGVLVGSDKTADTNWLNVTASADGKAVLKLKADPAITTRPKGSDPFDIRDCIDWLEPQWRLDAAKTKLEVQSRQVESLLALRGWNFSSKALLGELTDEEKTAASAGVSVSGFRDDTIPEAPRYRLALQPQDQFVVLSRELDIDQNERWLALCVSRHPATTTPTLAQVRVNGRAVLQQLVPDRAARTDPDPILAPVSEFAGKKARVEVVLIAQGDKSLIDWRGAKLLTRRPGLVKLFDEEEEFLKTLRDGEGEASLASTEKTSGNVSLKIAGGEYSHVIGDGGLSIREFPQLGEYRYFRFAWKKDGGTGIGLRIGHDGQFGVPEVEAGRQGRVRAVPEKVARARALRNRQRRVRNPRAPDKTDARGAQFGYQYDAGTRDAEEPVLRLDKKLPAKWTPQGRDIFGEFGSFSLTGLSFSCPDGTAAYFDGIYLARTQNDFQYIPEAIGGSLEADVSENENVIASARRPENLGVLLSKVAPQFTLDKIGEPVLHLKEFAGRKDVIQTMPPAQNVPCVLRAPVSVRAGKKTVLAVAANRHAEGDWQLNVKVGAEQLHTSLVDATTTKDGWVELEVDLSKFAGKNIVVEVHNHPNNWSYEHAYWSKLAILEK